jgi:phospholipid transport system substrate-binding protein
MNAATPIFALVCLAVLDLPARAQPGQGGQSRPSPIAFLKQHDEKVKKILAQAPQDTLPAAQRAQVKQLINAAFDFAELSRLALGDHWEQRTSEERAHFTRTFSAIIEEQNFDSFVRYYREGKIDYVSEEISGGQARVAAQVPLKREQIAITYLLHVLDDQWRVYDLVIDGVSTAEGNRRRYARYLEKNSYQQLIEQLDKQLARLHQSRS